MVVLELCESRYKHLVEEDKAKQAAGAGSEKEKRLSTAFSELKEFQSRYGILQTMLVALLSSSAEVSRTGWGVFLWEWGRQEGHAVAHQMSLLTQCDAYDGDVQMQRMLSVERGCEFKTSIRLAEANKAKIVLGTPRLELRYAHGSPFICAGSQPSYRSLLCDALLKLG